MFFSPLGVLWIAVKAFAACDCESLLVTQPKKKKKSHLIIILLLS